LYLNAFKEMIKSMMKSLTERAGTDGENTATIAPTNPTKGTTSRKKIVRTIILR